jgi:hypothetical protein
VVQLREEAAVNEDPCYSQSEALRDAIHAWIEASESTREFFVTQPWSIDRARDTFSPDYFRAMQRAYEREAQARDRYIAANRALYDCKDRHGLIE